MGWITLKIWIKIIIKHSQKQIIFPKILKKEKEKKTEDKDNLMNSIKET